MSRYRKRPVVVDAWPFGDPIVTAELIAAGCPLVLDNHLGGRVRPFIATLEGEMEVSPGDWIIRGVAGEFYPCKPDIFAATYEEAE